MRRRDFITATLVAPLVASVPLGENPLFAADDDLFYIDEFGNIQWRGPPGVRFTVNELYSFLANADHGPPMDIEPVSYTTEIEFAHPPTVWFTIG